MTTEVGVLLSDPLTTTAGDESVGAVVELGQILITGITPIAALAQVDAATPTLTAAVYDSGNDSQLATLGNSFDRHFQDELSGHGSWQLRVAVGDSAAQYLVRGNHVRFYVGGELAFTGRIDRRHSLPIHESEEYGQNLTVSGKSHIAGLEDHRTYPYGGKDALPVADGRVFSWASPEYDASGWQNAVVQYDRIAFQLGLDPPLMEPWFPPKGWPTPMTVKWIWSRARYSGGASQHPAGRCYFRKTVNLASDMSLAMFVSGDDRPRVFLDGKEVIGWVTQFPEDAFLDCWRTVVPVEAGEHVIAIEAETYEGNPDRPRRGMVALSVHEAPTGSATYSSSTLVVGTDETWKCLDYPTTVPAPTPGKILITLNNERNARTGGSAKQWTPTFTEYVDSAGNPWSDPREFTCRVGQDSTLDVYDALADISIDYHAEPGGRVISAWNKDSAAARAATFTAGTDITNLAFEDRSAGLKNVMLTRGREGFRERVDSSDVSSNGRREGFLSLANVDDASALDEAADKYMESLTVPVPAIVAGIESITEAQVAYVGWRVRDQLNLPDEEGTPTDYRVTAITVTEDEENGALTFTPELQSKLEVNPRRVERWLKRLGDGTLDGRSAGTTPIDREASPGIVPSAKQAIVTQTFSQQLPEAEESPAWSPTTRGRLVAVDAKLEVNPGTAGTILRVKKNGTAITFNQNGTSTSNLVMPPGINWIYAFVESADVAVGETDKITVETVQAGDETERLSVQVLHAPDPEIGYEPTF